MPWTCLVRSANARGWDRTGQRAQIALASAACSSDLPVDEIGKNRPGSAGRQAASCHHLPSAVSRAPSARYGGSRAVASSRRLGRGYAPRAPRPARKGRAWLRCGGVAHARRRADAADLDRLPRPCHRHASHRNPGRWPRLAGTSTGTAVRGRPILRCSGRANHQDPVTPPNLPGGKPGSGPPLGRKLQKRIDMGETAWGAARRNEPKGDPP